MLIWNSYRLSFFMFIPKSGFINLDNVVIKVLQGMRLKYFRIWSLSKYYFIPSNGGEIRTLSKLLYKVIYSAMKMNFLFLDVKINISCYLYYPTFSNEYFRKFTLSEIWCQENLNIKNGNQVDHNSHVLNLRSFSLDKILNCSMPKNNINAFAINKSYITVFG